MELASNILETNSFVVTSSDEIFQIVENFKTLKHKNIIIHIVSFTHDTDLVQNLNNELNIAVPHAKITLLKHNEKSKTYLNVYTLQKDISAQDFNNKILSKLYIDSAYKDT
ncbi:MAG: hypothetical protein KAS26_04120, partial [Sulfurimonas sp.]|nr:hypothetical protein [Sulfurimonas sp.]